MTIFCKDCKFCVPTKSIFGKLDYKNATCCNHAVLAQDDSRNEPTYLVTGKLPAKTPIKCSYARKWGNLYCTPQARYFEPTESTDEKSK